MKMEYRNYYFCDQQGCGNEWSNERPAVCADHCPECDHITKPHESDVIEEDSCVFLPESVYESLI
jgi:hypothetical protein